MVTPDSVDLVRIATAETPTSWTIENKGTAFDNLTTFTFVPIASMTIKTTTEEVFTFLPLEKSTKTTDPTESAKASTEQSTPDGEISQNVPLLTTEMSSATIAGGSTTEKASTVDQVENPDKAEFTESSEDTSKPLSTETSEVTRSTVKVENSGMESDETNRRHSTSSSESHENDSNFPPKALPTQHTSSDGFPHDKIATETSDESSADEDNPKDHVHAPPVTASSGDPAESDEKAENDLNNESQSPPHPDPLEITSSSSKTTINSPTDEASTETSRKTSPLLDFAYFNDRNESKVVNDSRKPRLRNFFYYYFLTAIRVNDSRERELNRTYEEAEHDRILGLPGDPSVLSTTPSVLLTAAGTTCDAIFHNFIFTFSAQTQKIFFKPLIR